MAVAEAGPCRKYPRPHPTAVVVAVIAAADIAQTAVEVAVVAALLQEAVAVAVPAAAGIGNEILRQGSSK